MLFDRQFNKELVGEKYFLNYKSILKLSIKLSDNIFNDNCSFYISNRYVYINKKKIENKCILLSTILYKNYIDPSYEGKIGFKCNYIGCCCLNHFLIDNGEGREELVYI